MELLPFFTIFISIYASYEGDDHIDGIIGAAGEDFYLRILRRRRHRSYNISSKECNYSAISASRGERCHCSRAMVLNFQWISIHAPMRRATGERLALFPTSLISIHAPRGGATADKIVRSGVLPISIHAPMQGTTVPVPKDQTKVKTFQSTLPMRGATRVDYRLYAMPYISIHAPHAGSDEILAFVIAQVGISNHAPHGGSDMGRDSERPDAKCISNHAPHAGSDAAMRFSGSSEAISIHTPHAGSDHARGGRMFSISLFLSTLPMRGATCTGV